jgi:polysaccharide export outer membrane protein
MLSFLHHEFRRATLVFGLLAGWAAVCGCESQPTTFPPPPAASHETGASTVATPTAAATDNPSAMVLRESDILRISFPGAPSLDSIQTIRRDGKITLDMVGEIKAAGLTAPALEQQLLKAYGDQLVTKEVTVTVQTSVFVVYVTGAVLRPGKLVSDRVETPLEAVIEAGLDPAKANLKKIVVIRENVNGQTQHFNLNLDDVIKGKTTVPFTLRSMDKIYVPEKFTWF